MTLAELIPSALRTSIFLLVLSVGLTATVRDATHLFREPGKLLRMVVAMNVVVPVFAVALVLAFDFHHAVRIALVAIAISPVPPFLPIKATRTGGQRTYAVGLLVAAAALSIVLVPLTIALLDWFSPATLAMSPAAVAAQMSISVFAPLAAGIAARRLAPGLAVRVARPVLAVAVASLAVALLPALVGAGPAMLSLLGNGTVLAFAALVVAGLVAGHLLGGGVPEERAMLALASGSRHPAVAVALARANFPDDTLVLPAVLLYLVVCAVATLAYARWTGRPAGGPAAPG